MNPPRSALLTGLLAASIVLVVTACSQPSQRLSPIAIPDPAWDAVLTRTSGWNGGDIGHSIDLGDHRTLWLFGDSIVGPVADSHRVGDRSRMLRAGIAWHNTPAPGSTPSEIAFAGTEPFDGLPAAPWTSPPSGLFPSGSWYWLMNDAVRRGPPFDDLILFATAIGPSGNPDGMWNFRRIGGAIITISNPADPPPQWHSLHAINPRVSPTPAFGEPQHDSDNFAAAIVQWPPRSRCYALFGVHESATQGKTLTLATAAESDLTRPDAWNVRPSPTLADGQPVVVADEFTVHSIRIDRRDVLVLITSGPFGSRTVLAYTALAPEGPWSPGAVVATTPDPGHGGMVYAAKGHAHLSGPGELLLTYVVNADLGRVFGDVSLYRPRFVRIPLSMLPRPPGRPQPRPDR